MNFTDAQLVEKYLALKTHIAARKEAYEAELKPFTDGMAMIENAFLQRLNERGADNTKTDFGTAYKSTLLNVKVVDRDAFMQHCIDHWDTYGSEMLNVSALKDPVKQYLDDNGVSPPGTDVSYFTRVNIRRS